MNAAPRWGTKVRNGRSRLTHHSAALAASNQSFNPTNLHIDHRTGNISQAAYWFAPVHSAVPYRVAYIHLRTCEALQSSAHVSIAEHVGRERILTTANRVFSKMRYVVLRLSGYIVARMATAAVTFV